MSDFSKQLLHEINSVRTNPQEFAQKLRSYEQYFKGNVLRFPKTTTGIMTHEGFKAFKDAADFLSTFEPVKELYLDSNLVKVADDSMKEILKFTKTEEVNKINLEEQVMKYGQVFGLYSQAIDFGSSNPELALINLLTDDGDPNRGNRGNLLNPKFKLIGISHCSHQTFHNCTVLIYVRHFIPNGEDVGVLSDENYQQDYIQDKKAKPSILLEKNENHKVTAVKSGNKDRFKSDVTPSSNNNNKDDDFDVPEGVLKIERQEKMVEEKGKAMRVIKETRYMEDGSIETNILKVPLN
jgi:uncharacterized protein YkwD